LTDKTALIGALAFSLLLVLGAFNDFLLIAVLPIVVILGWWSIKRLDLYIGFILLAVPLSINLQELEVTSLGLYMPTEPLLFGALIIFLFRFLKGWPVDKRIFWGLLPVAVKFYDTNILPETLHGFCFVDF
jgi:hypothetical protein